MITRAYDHLLTAETSCNFYWGSRWVHRSFDDLEQAYYLLDATLQAGSDHRRNPVGVSRLPALSRLTVLEYRNTKLARGYRKYLRLIPAISTSLPHEAP